jgi:phage terminase small subunit
VTASPRGLRAPGRRLWEAVISGFELDPPELELLGEACRTVDLIAVLRAEAAKNGVVIASNQGPRIHPAVVEARQQRLTLAKLLSALGLPKGLADDDGGQ